MTLELVDLDRVPGYAGPLHAVRNPALADRFHFWRGASGRRYACTRFPVNRAPAYEDAVALFVRRRGSDAMVLGASTLPGCPVIPLGTEEIHLHIVRGGADALAAAFEDLSALVAPLNRSFPRNPRVKPGEESSAAPAWVPAFAGTNGRRVLVST